MQKYVFANIGSDKLCSMISTKTGRSNIWVLCGLQNIFTNVACLVQETNSQSVDGRPVWGISVKW